MIETRVRVTAVATGTAWVAASEESGCGACKSQSVCGLSGLGKFMSNRRPDLRIERAEFDTQPGDELLVSIDAAELLRAGLFAYLLPAVLAVATAAIADTSGAGDLACAGAALLGLGIGLGCARLLAPKPRIQARPLSSTRSTT